MPPRYVVYDTGLLIRYRYGCVYFLHTPDVCSVLPHVCSVEFRLTPHVYVVTFRDCTVGDIMTTFVCSPLPVTPFHLPLYGTFRDHLICLPFRYNLRCDYSGVDLLTGYVTLVVLLLRYGVDSRCRDSFPVVRSRLFIFLTFVAGLLPIRFCCSCSFYGDLRCSVILVTLI